MIISIDMLVMVLYSFYLNRKDKKSSLKDIYSYVIIDSNCVVTIRDTWVTLPIFLELCSIMEKGIFYLKWDVLKKIIQTYCYQKI